MTTIQHHQVKAVAKRYSVGVVTIWRWVRDGKFPKPVHFTPGCTRWSETDLQAWEASRNGGAK